MKIKIDNNLPLLCAIVKYLSKNNIKFICTDYNNDINSTKPSMGELDVKFKSKQQLNIFKRKFNI
jgi:hypothetical protein